AIFRYEGSHYIPAIDDNLIHVAIIPDCASETPLEIEADKDIRYIIAPASDAISLTTDPIPSATNPITRWMPLIGGATKVTLRRPSETRIHIVRATSYITDVSVSYQL
ncbi:MAG: hypothetical protein AAF403_01875, partial [Pseudomonadota bacterium]